MTFEGNALFFAMFLRVFSSCSQYLLRALPFFGILLTYIYAYILVYTLYTFIHYILYIRVILWGYRHLLWKFHYFYHKARILILYEKYRLFTVHAHRKNIVRNHALNWVRTRRPLYYFRLEKILLEKTRLLWCSKWKITAHTMNAGAEEHEQV